MAANSHNVEEHSNIEALSRKRPREYRGDSVEPPEKRNKEEKAALLKEAIRIQAYFSLTSQDVINEDQVEEWSTFKGMVKECFPFVNRDLDDHMLFVYVPQSVLPALERINYKEINLEILEIMLKKWAEFIEILSQLKNSSKSHEECEELFMQLNLCIEEEDIDLTLTESGGWNVLHIAAFRGRVDLLIRIQQQLLPKKLEQYKRLLGAKTNRRKVEPIAIKKAPHRREIALLLSEESLPSLKEKQFTVMLRMRLAHGQEPQCATFYEQLKQLIAEGVDPTVTQNIIGVTILHAAVYIGDIELVTHILQHASLKQCAILLNAKTKKEQTATSIAENKNYREIGCLLKEREELIAIFKDLNILQKIENKQPLYERIKQFIKNGGDPTVTDDRGLNFLHYVASFPDITLGLLIKDNANPEHYRELLSAQSQKQKLTPYGIVLKYKKKSSEYENLLKLLNPKENQNVAQPSQQSYGQVPFFSSPTLLSDGDKPVSSQATSSLAIHSPHD